MDKKDSFFTSMKFIVILFGAIILLCILDIANIPSKFGISSIELNPWTNLAITSIFVIFSAVITIRSVLLSIKNQENQRKEDNEKAVLPMGKIDKPDNIKIRREEESITSVISRYDKAGKTEKIESFKPILFEFKNVGKREMYDISIQYQENDYFHESDIQSLAPVVYAGDSIIVSTEITTKRPIIERNSTVADIGGSIVKSVSPIIMNIYYLDCYKNKYRQQFQIETTYRWMKILESKKTFRDFENPELVGFKILSAPEIVE